MINKGLLFLGILLVIAGFAGVFVFAQLVDPLLPLSWWQKRKLKKGTKSADLPAGSLARKTLRGDSDVIASFMTEATYGENSPPAAVSSFRISPLAKLSPWPQSSLRRTPPPQNIRLCFWMIPI